MVHTLYSIQNGVTLSSVSKLRLCSEHGPLTADKVDTQVSGQWVHCKADGAAAKWERNYVVIDDGGTLTLFDDDAMEFKIGSFNLTLWTKDDIVESQIADKAGSYRISLRSEEGVIHFAFDSEQSRRGMMERMMSFVEDNEDEAVIDKSASVNAQYVECSRFDF